VLHEKPAVPVPPAVLHRLHSQELHWVPIIDCGIPQDPTDPAYVEGLDANVFIKDRTGEPYLGVVSTGGQGVTGNAAKT
jgi:hypothetical protein